ncbi:MAG: BrnT family toxin [Actinomycetota bacterium]
MSTVQQEGWAGLHNSSALRCRAGRCHSAGLAFVGRLLVVVHTYSDGVVRIISARQATKTERG